MAKNVNPIVDETAKADATVEAVVDTECHSPVIDNTSSKPDGEVEETKEVETSTEAAVADQVTETIEADKSTEIEVVKPEASVVDVVGQSSETVETSTTTDEVKVTDTEISPANTADEELKTVTDLPEEKVDLNFQTEAETLMASQNVKEIWRCPVKGYWFTKAENALDHSKKVDKSPEHYKL